MNLSIFKEVSITVCAGILIMLLSLCFMLSYGSVHSYQEFSRKFKKEQLKRIHLEQRVKLLEQLLVQKKK